MTLPVAGDRIELLSMPDDPDPIPTGSTGTVLWSTPEQVVVDWDIRRSLSLIVGVDRWRVL